MFTNLQLVSQLLAHFTEPLQNKASSPYLFRFPCKVNMSGEHKWEKPQILFLIEAK